MKSEEDKVSDLIAKLNARSNIDKRPVREKLFRMMMNRHEKDYINTGKDIDILRYEHALDIWIKYI